MPLSAYADRNGQVSGLNPGFMVFETQAFAPHALSCSALMHSANDPPVVIVELQDFAARAYGSMFLIFPIATVKIHKQWNMKSKNKN